MTPKPKILLYKKVEESLFDRICSGEFPPGMALPTEGELERQYLVSRITIRRALDELTRRQLVVRRQGAGTFVRDSGSAVRTVRLTASLDDVLPLNRHEVLRREKAWPDPQIAEFLQVPPGASVDRVVALNVLDVTRFAFVVFDIPERFGALLEEKDFCGRIPPIQHIQARSGLTLRNCQQVVEAAIATGEIAEQLHLSEGTPLLKLSRVYLAEREIPLEALTLFYHPERYRMSVELLPMQLYREEPVLTALPAEDSRKKRKN